ncbi:MAG: glycosyltransferase [Pyrinomonadaceae bacterium]
MSTDQPLVSVIIPNYNYASYVGEAIDSVLAQDYPNVEVIVVDDGSSDDSRAVVERYGERVSSIFQPNQGVCATRNNGVVASSGEFVAFIDADDAWMPTKLSRQMERLTNADVGLVHVGVSHVDGAGKAIREDLDGKEGRVANDLLLLKPVILGGGSGVVIRRHIFDEVGGFDTRLSTSADWELYYRIATRCEVAFVPEALVRYRVHGANMHNNIAAMEHDVRIGFEKAFADESADVQAIRSEAVGSFHTMLAGSYFHQAEYGKFLTHAIASVWNKPSNIGNFFARKTKLAK